MSLTIEPGPLPGIRLLAPKVYNDERGSFFELWRSSDHKLLGLDVDFVQHNVSVSQRGALRGLHFQREPHAQGKLISVMSGSIYDVAVDIRPDSPSFGKYFALTLTATNPQALYLPPGYAHGFVALEDHTVVTYQCSVYYHQASESGIHYADPDLAIAWPDCGVPYIVSAKDQTLVGFRKLVQELGFTFL